MFQAENDMTIEELMAKYKTAETTTLATSSKVAAVDSCELLTTFHKAGKILMIECSSCR